MDILSFASTENQSLVALVNGSSVCDVAIVASQFAAIFIRRGLDLEGATNLARWYVPQSTNIYFRFFNRTSLTLPSLAKQGSVKLAG